MYLKPNTSIGNFIVYATHVLDLLEKTPEALQELAGYGYGATKLQEGRQLFEQLTHKNQELEEQKRAQKAATDEFHELWAQLRNRYQAHVQIARRVLGRDAEQLLRAMPSGYTEWVVRASAFYQAMLTNLLYQQKMSELGISSDELSTGSQMLEAVIARKSMQTQRTQSALNATQQRKQALAEAQEWFSTLSAISRIAFRRFPAIQSAFQTNSARPANDAKPKPISEPTISPASAPELAPA